MDPPRTRSDWLRLRQCCFQEALRVLRHREDAEEAAQEALLRAWRHRGARRSEAWLPWVRAIARNEALRVGERRQRFAAREVHSAEPPDPEALTELDGVVDALSLRSLLGPLRQDERDLLRLRYEEDLTNPEIARRLGLPEGTVKVRLHRLRTRLRAGYEQGELA
jgi:RNA polymerase sigma-70 factor (ECF subfamily)